VKNVVHQEVQVQRVVHVETPLVESVNVSSNRSFTVESSSQTSPSDIELASENKVVSDGEFVPEFTSDERKKLDEQLRNVNLILI
jgi:hypothetical protein